MGAMGPRGARAVLCGVALLCALGLGQRPPGEPSCGPGSVLRGAGNDARCCGACASGKALAGRAWDAAGGGGCRRTVRVRSPQHRRNPWGGGCAPSSRQAESRGQGFGRFPQDRSAFP